MSSTSTTGATGAAPLRQAVSALLAAAGPSHCAAQAAMVERRLVELETESARAVHEAREDAQRHALESDRRLRTLVESADVIVWEYDCGSERFTYVSPQCCRLGYAPSAWMAPGFLREIIHRDDLPGVLADRSATAHGAGAHRLLYRVVSADGGIRWLQDTASATRHDDGGIVLRGVFADVTAFKETERALAQAKEAAERESRTKSDFLAGMSHEIRTPMTAVLGFTDYLRDLLDSGEPTDEIDETLDILKRSGEHLLQVVNDILDLSKVEAGRLDVRPGACSPGRLLADIERLLGDQARRKGLALIVETDRSLPSTIVTDGHRLRQVIINLVGNALKFTEAGHIKVIARYRPQSRSVEIDVEDTGVGMTAEEAETIFEPYAQTGTDDDRKQLGSGLGLTISRNFAHALGGDIDVKSTARGAGTTFRVTLPQPVDLASLPDAPASESQSPESQSPESPSSAEERKARPDKCALKLQGARILLADDCADSRVLIRKLLGRAGAEVTAVTNGRDAVDEALRAANGSEPFDMVLMDLEMPVMSGVAALRALRDGGFPRPVIALTAHAMDSDRDRCLKAGFDDFESKPFDWARLLEKLARYRTGA